MFKRRDKKSNIPAVAYAVFVALVVVSSIFAIATPQPAHACWQWLCSPVQWTTGKLIGAAATAAANVSSNLIGWILYIVMYFVTMIVSFFIAIVVYFIGVILQLNTNIVNSLAVQSGFTITLAVANLGFVLGIIVIAIMTIIRNETYGMKHILWKFVVAAILVNFSLVIGGVLINTADLFTNYFLSAFPGGGGGLSAASNFSSALAGAFVNTATSLTSTSTIAGGGLTGTASQFGSGLASIITPIFEVGFVLIMLAMIFITLGTFFFMLLVRYIELSILLILMPLVWLFWVFPKLEHLWDKWWNEFLRWTFFAPIVIFFLYLAIATSSAMSGAHNGGVLTAQAGLGALGYTAPSSIPVLSSLSSILGSFVNTIIGTALQAIIVIGLAVGGMVAADKMSITGASAAINSMKGESGVGKWLKHQGIKGTRAGWQRAGGQKFAARLSSNQNAVIKKLQGVPVAGWLASRGASLLGRGLEGVQTNEHLVEEAKKGVPANLTKDEWKERIEGNMNEQDMLGHFMVGMEKGWVRPDTKFNGRAAGDIIDDKDLIGRNGVAKFAKDYDKAMFSSRDLREAEKITDPVRRKAAMEAALENIAKTRDPEDFSKINANSILEDDVVPGSIEDERRQMQTEAIARYAPQALPKIIGKASSKSRTNLDSIITSHRMPVIHQEALIENNTKDIETQEALLAPIKQQIDQINADIKKEEDNTKKAVEEAEHRLKGDDAAIKAEATRLYNNRDVAVRGLTARMAPLTARAAPIETAIAGLRTATKTLSGDLTKLKADPIHAPWEKVNDKLNRLLAYSSERI